MRNFDKALVQLSEHRRNEASAIPKSPLNRNGNPNLPLQRIHLTLQQNHITMKWFSFLQKTTKVLIQPQRP